jgi:Flp pilus assembly pilin Flp
VDRVRPGNKDLPQQFELTLPERVPTMVGSRSGVRSVDSLELRQTRPAYNESAMKTLLLRFFTDESAATTAKYGLVAAVISAAIVTAALGIVTKLTMTATLARVDQ